LQGFGTSWGKIGMIESAGRVPGPFGALGPYVVHDGRVGAIFPLSAAELNQVFGTRQPSTADFDRGYQPGPGGPLGRLCGERWTGRSIVIHEDGNPTEVYFWGFSGD
jgi:hypothetical protein